MVGDDSEIGEASVFFPLGFTYPKPDFPSRYNFQKVVAESSTSGAHYSQYPILCDADPYNPYLICLPRNGEETIFSLQIDVGLYFPTTPTL